MLNIDHLSDLPAYQAEMQAQLVEAGIDGVDFSDCHVPQGLYLEQDKAFFTALEDKVHHYLAEGGWSQCEINQLQALRHQFQPASWSKPIEDLSPQDMAEQADRARALTRRFETNVAEISRDSVARVTASETRVASVEAQLRAAQVQTRVGTSDDEIQAALTEAETRIAQTEARVQQTEAALEATRKELHEVHQANHHHWQLAETRHQQIQELLDSTSWRITAPLRMFRCITKSVFRLPKTAKSKIKDQVKLFLIHAKLYINQRPRIRRAILNSPRLRFIARWAINRYPRLRFVARDLMGIEGVRLNARSFDQLTSVRIMNAMSNSFLDATNIDSVIFLQVTHEK